MDKYWQVFAILTGVVVLIIIFSLTTTSDNKQPMTNDEQNTQGEQATTTATTTASTTVSTTSSVTTEPKTNSVATFTTNYGQFAIQLENAKAPKTVANFVKLAQAGFYDGQRFHRVIEDFMIQGGDPLSKDLAKKAFWGTGDPGYKFADEFGAGLSNVTGTISMANSGPNTNGSQFFINTNDNTFLDGKHAVFGKVISGMDVVMTISKVEKDQSDKPIKDVVISRVEIK